MDNYKFRFGKRDWTEVDEEAIAEKIDAMKGKDLSDEEFAAELGMTLFYEASETDEDRDIFKKVLDKFFGGKVDTRTLAILWEMK